LPWPRSTPGRTCSSRPVAWRTSVRSRPSSTTWAPARSSSAQAHPRDPSGRAQYGAHARIVGPTNAPSCRATRSPLRPAEQPFDLPTPPAPNLIDVHGPFRRSACPRQPSRRTSKSRKQTATASPSPSHRLWTPLPTTRDWQRRGALRHHATTSRLRRHRPYRPPGVLLRYGLCLCQRRPGRQTPLQLRENADRQPRLHGPAQRRRRAREAAPRPRRRARLGLRAGRSRRKHPNWKVILAHSGPRHPHPAAACLAERTQNVYLELCTSFPGSARARGRATCRSPQIASALTRRSGCRIRPRPVPRRWADLVATTSTAREVFAL
jgi:hypothetical protein